MKDQPATPEPAPPSPHQRFEDLARHVFNVPKAEIDKREEKYQKERKKSPKRGPKPE